MVYFLFRYILHGFCELLFTPKKAETPPPSNTQIYMYIYKRISIYFMLVLTNLPRHYIVIFKALHIFHMHRHTHTCTCTCLLPEYCLHVLATFGVAPACKWPFEVDGINMAIHLNYGSLVSFACQKYYSALLSSVLGPSCQLLF